MGRDREVFVCLSRALAHKSKMAAVGSKSPPRAPFSGKQSSKLVLHAKLAATCNTLARNLPVSGDTMRPRLGSSTRGKENFVSYTTYCTTTTTATFFNI